MKYMKSWPIVFQVYKTINDLLLLQRKNEKSKRLFRCRKQEVQKAGGLNHVLLQSPIKSTCFCCYSYHHHSCNHVNRQPSTQIIGLHQLEHCSRYNGPGQIPKLQSSIQKKRQAVQFFHTSSNLVLRAEAPIVPLLLSPSPSSLSLFRPISTLMLAHTPCFHEH